MIADARRSVPARGAEPEVLPRSHEDSKERRGSGRIARAEEPQGDPLHAFLLRAFVSSCEIPLFSGRYQLANASSTAAVAVGRELVPPPAAAFNSFKIISTSTADT